jgi:hypothetical protein
MLTTPTNWFMAAFRALEPYDPIANRCICSQTTECGT